MCVIYKNKHNDAAGQPRIDEPPAILDHFLIPAANTSSSPRSSNTVDISEMMSDVSEITSTKKTCEIVL